MKVTFLAAIATAVILGSGFVIAEMNKSTSITTNSATSLQANLEKDNPCASKNPCAGKTAKHPEIYTENGVALDGQDVVAYFTVKRPVQGSRQFTYQWNGAVWQFSSAQNRDLFAQNPEKYAPQYGGYCAKAASDGHLATTIPEAWEVRDGKLYLNYSLEAQKEWRVDTETKIAKANANWKGILANDTLYR